MARSEDDDVFRKNFEISRLAHGTAALYITVSIVMSLVKRGVLQQADAVSLMDEAIDNAARIAAFGGEYGGIVAEVIREYRDELVLPRNPGTSH
jgi:hypothetical protein